MNLTVSTPGLERLQQRLQQYLEVNKRNSRELLRKKAADFGIQAYKATKAAAPTPQKIAQKVTSLGWRVKRKAGAWPRQAGDKPGAAMRRMQAAQIGTRIHRIGYVATGWLPAIRIHGRDQKVRIKMVHAPRGRVEFLNFESDKPTILIANSTPGILAVEREHGIIETAANAVADDIEKYTFPRLGLAA